MTQMFRQMPELNNSMFHIHQYIHVKTTIFIIDFTNLF